MSMKFSGEVPVLRAGGGRTKQAHAKRCDINTIVARYNRTGYLDNVNRARPYFADVSKIGDLHSVMNRIAMAEEAFSLLPSHLRARFNHSVGSLVSFISDDRNYDEAVKLGLVEKKDAPPSEAAPQGDGAKAPVVSK